MATFAAQLVAANINGTVEGDSISLDLNGTMVKFTAKEYYPGAQQFLATNAYNSLLSLGDAVNNYCNDQGINYEAIFLDVWPNYYLLVKATEYGVGYNFDPPAFVGTSLSLTRNILNVDPPAVDADVQVISCFGSGTGSITLAITGGTDPYTVEWDDGSTGLVRSNLPVGVYRVTVTDSTPLSPEQGIGTGYHETHPGVTVFEIDITQNPRITATATIIRGSIILNVQGGVPGYTYLWSDGVTTKDRQNIQSGTYRVSVTDSVGCARTFEFTVAIDRFYFSKNPVELSLAAADHQNKPNLTFLCEVWVEPVYKSDVFVKITEDPLEQPADSSGRTTFNVQELLDAFLEPHIPAIDQAGIVRADPVFKRFYLRHTEKFGNPPVPGDFTQIENRYVVHGGLNDQEHYNQTFFSSYLQSQKPFLTWEPKEKKVFRDQPEYLYLMLYQDTPQFRVMGKVYFEDFTSSTYGLHLMGNVGKYEVFCFAAGHDQLKLADKKPGTRVTAWEIYAEATQGGAVISETRRFVVEEGYFNKRRYLLYSNSLGGTNTMVAVSRARLKADPDSQQLEKVITPGYNPQNGDVIVTSKQLKPSLELSTGYRDRSYILAQQDFLLARVIRLIADGRYMPVTLTNKNIVLDDEQDQVNYIDFEVQLPKLQQFTPVLQHVPAAPVSDTSGAIIPDNQTQQ